MASESPSKAEATTSAGPQEASKAAGEGSADTSKAQPKVTDDLPLDLATKLGFAPRFIPQWDEQVAGLDIHPPADIHPDQIVYNLPAPGPIKTVYCHKCELTWLVGHDSDKFGAHPYHNTLAPATAVDNCLDQRSVVVYIHGDFDREMKEDKSSTTCSIGSGLYFGPFSPNNLAPHGVLSAAEATKLVSELYAAAIVLRLIQLRIAPGWRRVLDEHQQKATARGRWDARLPELEKAVAVIRKMDGEGRDMRSQLDIISSCWRLLDLALRDFDVDVFRLLVFNKYPLEQLQTMCDALQRAVAEMKACPGEKVDANLHHPGIFGYDIFGEVDTAMWSCCKKPNQDAPGCQSHCKSETAAIDSDDTEADTQILECSDDDETEAEQAPQELGREQPKNKSKGKKSKGKKKKTTKKGKGKGKGKDKAKKDETEAAEAKVPGAEPTSAAKPAATTDEQGPAKDFDRDLRVIIATDSQMLYETVAIHMQQWEFNETTQKFKNAQGKAPKNNEVLVLIRSLQEQLAAAPPEESVKVVWYKISKKENDEAVDLAQTALRLASQV